MPQENVLNALILFAAVALVSGAIWIAISSFLKSRRARMKHRMASDSSPDLTLAPPPPQGWSARMDTGFDQMIVRTGLDINPGLALGFIVAFGLLLATIVFVLRWEEEAWLVIPAFLLGGAIPLLFFLWRQQAWRRTLQQQLPDVLFLLARSIRAGRSIDQAFQLVGEQGVPPLAHEFATMTRQLELGLSLTQVLQSTSRRLKLTDFNVFASIISLHRTTGGNLPLLLDRLATTTRDRNQFEGQYRAATVLGRYSAAFIVIMVGVILIHLFFFQRDWALRFFDTTQSYMGVILFSVAIGLEILGGLLLYWFLQYDY